MSSTQSAAKQRAALAREGDDRSYEDMLDTLSQGSVARHFDPFVDIDWDSPEFQVDPHDPRWTLSTESDPLGAQQWYQDLPHEDKVRIGLWRGAHVVKVGSVFESILIRGMMQYCQTLPPNSAEFRYCMHEMTEECNHIQMFQMLFNKMGADDPHFPLWLRGMANITGNFAFLPTVFFIGILAGEEPIDHFQKSMIREDLDIPPAMRRVMQIHIAEEARHISFAHQFLRERVVKMNKAQRFGLSLAYPVIMRFLAGVIMAPQKKDCRKHGIPDAVRKQAFWKSPQSKAIMSEYFGDVRMLANELELMNPVSRRVWKKLGIAGEESRFRGDPHRRAREIRAA